MIPAIVGVVLGLLTSLSMGWVGMMTERRAAAAVLVAIAAFYPVFALVEGDVTSIVVHLAIFAVFLTCAALGNARGLLLIGLAIVAHGVFDAVTLWTGHPGPEWWPFFCAGFDLSIGLAVVAYGKKEIARVE